MLPVTVVGMIALAPGQSFAIGEFKSALLRDLHLTESILSALYGIATFLAGFTALLAGAAMDRFGLRRSITVSIVLLGSACLFAASVTGIVSVFIAFLLLRMVGHGALPLMTGTTLAMWFRRRLGFVTGMTGVAGTVATAGIPALYLWLISTYGWRTAWAILGIGTCVVMLPMMALVFRNHPGDVGQNMDGDMDGHGNDASHANEGLISADMPACTLSAARRTRAYWCLMALNAAHGLIFAAVMFHRVQIFESLGLAPQQAAAMFAVFCFCSAVAQFLTALIADRVPLHLLLAGTSVCVAAGLLLLGTLEGLAAGFLFSGLYGLGTGGEIVGRNTAWPAYFGTRHLGKIKGSSVMITVMGSSLGPLVVGLSFDHFGGYGQVMWMLAVLYGGIGFAMLAARAPGAMGRNGGSS